MFKVHVEETEELADQVARKYLSGVLNPEIAGNVAVTRAVPKPWLQSPPGITSREAQKMRIGLLGAAAASGPDSRGASIFATYEQQVKDGTITRGTPKSVIQAVRNVLETLRPGHIVWWDGDGAMSHEDQTRSLRLMGQEVIPATREIGKELGLLSSYEANDGAGYDRAAWARAQSSSKV
jgi:hypothetical protein